ncbi:SYP72 [Linum perenne]
MSVIDIIFRVDEICKKYDKYDIEKQRQLNAYGDDAFARLYATVEAEIEAAMGKADRASKESKRAVIVALNAEIRKTKTRLMDEVTKLQKLALKKVKFIHFFCISLCYHLNL